MRLFSLLLLSLLFASCANNGNAGENADTATTNNNNAVDTVRRPANENAIEPRTNGEF